MPIHPDELDVTKLSVEQLERLVEGIRKMNGGDVGMNPDPAFKKLLPLYRRAKEELENRPKDPNQEGRLMIAEFDLDLRDL